MQTQEVAIKRNLKIVLKADAAMLDEVVVVAYGAAKKSSLTGSVEIVKADQLSKVPVNSVDQALQGKAAGVQLDVREQVLILRFVVQVLYLPVVIHYS